MNFKLFKFYKEKLLTLLVSTYMMILFILTSNLVDHLISFSILFLVELEFEPGVLCIPGKCSLFCDLRSHLIKLPRLPWN